MLGGEGYAGHAPRDLSCGFAYARHKADLAAKQLSEVGT